MSATTYLIPLKVCTGVTIFEEYREVPLSTGKVFTFNDSNRHGINAPGWGINLAITVDFKSSRCRGRWR